jgi:hypothetical protein
MNPKVLAAGVLVAGCITAAAGGAYFAVRQNAAPPAAGVQTAPAAPASSAPSTAGQPVSETEAVVGTPDAKPAEPAAQPQAEAPEKVTPKPEPRRAPQTPPSVPPARSATAVAPSASAPAPVERPQDRVPVATAPVPPVEPVPEMRAAEPPPAPPEPQFEELVVPASSVIGLRVETPLSSERSRVEDRVDARVTRDVTAGGRVAIPAGSRVIGAVSEVDRGGKMKGAARLGVRFHTLVLADGREVPLRTEAVFREGDSPGNESARKIGGAAIGGAILGAIIGGGKGAAIGGAAGAGAGSAAVMAGDRNAATLPAGTVVNVRLSGPATIEVERR